MTDPTPSLAITSHTTHTDPRLVRHSELVKELARACWFEARGNGAEAARQVAQWCAQDTTGAYPQADQAPSAMAIRRWAEGDGWQLDLAQGVAQRFPATITHLHARLALMGDGALDTLEDLNRPGYLPSKEEKIKLEAAKHVTMLLGLGTAGARGGAPEVKPEPRQREDVSGMTPNERARRTREKIEADREARRKR